MLTTETPQEPENPIPGQAPVGPVHPADSVSATLDRNPTLSYEIQKALAESGEGAVDPPTKRGRLADLWAKMKAENTRQKDMNNKLGNAALRGAAEGVNGISNTIVGAAVGLSKKTGLYKVGRSPEEQQAFLKFWDQHTADANPIQIPEDHINKWFGPSQGGLSGFIEGAAQFATGLAAASSVGINNVILKGATADITAFDPFKKRLSNLIQDGPEWMKNPLTDMLSAKEGDTETAARFKQAAEGILTNGTIEAITHGVSALRASKAGKDITPAVEQAKAVKHAETDVAKVVPAGDGKFTVASTQAGEEAKLSVEHIDESHTFTQGEAESIAASFNYIAKNERFAPGPLDDQSVAAFRERMKAYADGKDLRTPEELRDAYGINVRYIQSPEEVVSTIKSMVDAMPEPSTMTRNRVVTHEETAALAADMFKDMPAEDVLQHAARTFGDTDRLPEQILAMRQWMQEQTAHTYKLSQMVEANPNNSVALEQLGQSLDTMLDFHAHLTGTSSNVGRALNIHQMPVGEAADALAKDAAEGATKAGTDALEADAKAVGGEVAPGATGDLHRAPASPKATAGLTPMQIRALARSIFLNGTEDPAAVLRLIRGPKVTKSAVATLDKTALDKFISFAQSVRMEAMLSGPKTQVTNTVSNVITMLQRPAEYWWAGVRTGNSGLREMGGEMYAGVFHSLRDSWNAAVKSFKVGDNVLIPGESHTGTTMGAIGDNSWLTNIAHAPSRFLMSADEFAKQMNYRMNMRAQILRDVNNMGITDPKEIAQRLSDGMQFAFDPKGGAVNPLAKHYAQENTFTNPLRPGSIQQKVLDLVNAHPMARVVLPFVRTPMNIFNYAWERTPILNRLNKDMQDAFAGKFGEEAKALAHAKSEMGTAMWSTGALLAAGGFLTGRGPTDVELRRQWVAAGHQPYSIKIPGTDTWISYRRANPVLTAFGLVADMVSMSNDSEDGDWTNVAASVAASLASNVTSQTFMQGFAEFSDAIGSGDVRRADKFINSVVTSFVPNVANQLNPDDTLRETRGMVDELAARIPGFSDKLEPRRNLLGEKIMRPPGYFNRSVNPFTAAPGVDPSSVQEELLKLGKAFQMPAEKPENGLIDLTDGKTFTDRGGQSPYDRMLELMAEPANGRPSLRTALTNLINNPSYQKAPAEDAYGPGGLRWKLANNVIQAYQQMAQATLLKEYPTLRQAYGQATDLKASGIAKGKSGVDAVMEKYSNLFLTK